jgi:nitroreductase
MEVHEALYTTRMMRRMKPDPIPLESQCRILDAAIRAPSGANIYPAIWSALLAARAEGIGGVLTTVLRYEERAVCELLAVPRDEGWRMIAMLALGYPRGRWGVAADRRPVHEVSSRNRWGDELGARVPEPLWPPS